MSSDTRLGDLREDYHGEPLTLEGSPADPLVLFQDWLARAVSSKVLLPNAMTLATVDPRGQPAARTVLLKEVDQRGLTFFTNYESDKARQLAQNPRATLLFFWPELGRQVRISGDVERISSVESDEYFSSRPRASNLSAMASPQSQVIRNKKQLRERVEELAAQWQGKELVRPDNWGGLRLRPRQWEFWQGQPDRLHDRIHYSKDAGDRWRVQRLAP